MFTVAGFTIRSNSSILLFGVVFVLNLLPAFAPPTWTAMSFIGLTIPEIDFIWIALVAATAATCGRIVLAKLSHILVRQRSLSEQARQNVDAIRLGIESRPVITFGTFLGHFISRLFQPRIHCLWPTYFQSLSCRMTFFCWTSGTRAFWLKTASAISDQLDVDWFESAVPFCWLFSDLSVALSPNHLLLHADRLARRIR